MKGIVIALGGNALGDTVASQKKAVEVAAKTIADIAETGAPLAIVHGNGPQVGKISAAMRCAVAGGMATEDMPLAECVAMSQGYIGFHLQMAIESAFRSRGIDRKVCTVTTQVLVDLEDPAFLHPTKPVGAFYTLEEAGALMRETGEPYCEDAGRGWRKVVASPEPKDILEKEVIGLLFRSGVVPICCGGGGIPVAQQNGTFETVGAVIDKDYAASKLAQIIDAEQLMILTGVDGVYLDYNTKQQRLLRQMSVSTAERYCEKGYFAQGSMLPKVRAATRFARCGGMSVITSLEAAATALKQKKGTWISLGPGDR